MPLFLTIVSKVDDPHNVVVLQLALEVAGRPDVILDLTKSGRALSLITLFFFVSSSLFLFSSIYYLLLVKKERESVWNGHLGEIPGNDRHSWIHIYSSVQCTFYWVIQLPFSIEEELKKHSFTIKEGIEYRLKVLFK